MKATILVIDDDPVLGEVVCQTLREYSVTLKVTGEAGLQEFARTHYDLVLCDLVLPGIGGLDVIRKIREGNPAARLMVISAHGTTEHLLATLRENVVDFMVKPFSTEELRCSVANLLAIEQAIEVVSATPQWVELRVPASFQIAASLESFFDNLHVELDEPTRRSVGTAFRELLNNAIEHGAKGDQRRLIGVSYIRMQRAIMYRIQDPGSGFDLSSLPHAAVSYPGDPLKHLEVRQQQGMRAGGYGLLWTQHLVDEVVFNQKRNKVIFIKYLDQPDES
jgi:DNA-binding response OmpR family regulator